MIYDMITEKSKIIVDNSNSQQQVICYPLVDERLKNILILNELHLNDSVRVQMMPSLGSVAVDSSDNDPLKLQINKLVGDRTGLCCE